MKESKEDREQRERAALRLMEALSAAEEELRELLIAAQNKSQDTGRFKLWKGRVKKREKNADR